MPLLCIGMMPHLFEIIIIVLCEIDTNLKLSLIKLNVTMGLFCYYWNRVGLKAMVLEQSNRLQAEGTSITLWNNAMKALELLDIDDQLRNTYVNVLGSDFP